MTEHDKPTGVGSTTSVVVDRSAPDPETAERLLRLLPAWFGIESATLEYVEDARSLPTYLATLPDGPPIGLLLVRRHFPETAEIQLIAVHPDHHREGVGRRLLAAAESDLTTDGVQLLQVKTLGPSRPDAGYERTRRFYLGTGFLPVEEFAELWPGNPCLLMVKPISPG